jgi:hypothetical protein
MPWCLATPRQLLAICLVPLAAICSLPANSASQGDGVFLNASFNEPGWHYMLRLMIPNPMGGDPDISLLVNADVEPGGSPDSVSIMWLLGTPVHAGYPDSVRISTSSASIMASIRWRADHGETISFTVPLASIEELAESDGNFLFRLGQEQLALNRNFSRLFRALVAAAREPDQLARVAYGPGSTAADLREPLDSKRQLEEIAAFSIRYDRFEDRFVVAVKPLRTHVYRGADSVYVRAVYHVDRGRAHNLMALGFDVFGADRLTSQGTMRLQIGTVDTVMKMPEGSITEMDGGSRILFIVDASLGSLVSIGDPTEFRIGFDIEFSLPSETKRILGQANDMTRTRGNVEKWAKDIYGCEDLIQMSREGRPCVLTRERLESLFGGSQR